MNHQERNNLKAKINANSHEIYVLSLDNMEKIIESSNSPKKALLIRQWSKYRKDLEVASNYGHYVKDGTSLTKLFSDLGITAFKAYTKNYGGNTHEALQGRERYLGV